MNADEFNTYHTPALEQDEARHNLLLALMRAPSGDPWFQVRRWSLGARGACAVQGAAARPIVLGDLNEAQCHTLAEWVHGLDFGGVQGPDNTAHWFVARARQLGVNFGEPMPLGIQSLTTPPVYPDTPGTARTVTPDDHALFASWTHAFHAEATPDDPKTTDNWITERVNNGRAKFWAVEGKPVSVAVATRGTPKAGGIGLVYTSPEARGRGYAGSVTAAIADLIFAEGKSVACLYTDMRNPYSNRCYAKIGFRQICSSWQYPRQ